MPRENLLLYDVHGLVHPAAPTSTRTSGRSPSAPRRPLAEGLRGADVFLGASAGGCWSPEMIRSMGRFPIVFAMATPEPEIGYEQARAARRDVIVATSLGQDPNAIVDLLSFPYIFRGALDVQASRISETMMLAAARALAELAREEVPEEVSRAYGDETFTFGPEYLLPKPIDPRILVRESAAVARQAMDDGLARRPVDLAAYEEQPHRPARHRARDDARDHHQGAAVERASSSPKARTRRCCAPAPCWSTRASPPRASGRRGGDPRGGRKAGHRPGRRRPRRPAEQPAPRCLCREYFRLAAAGA